MTPDYLNLVKKINQLWNPVYPYLAQHIHELYSRNDGVILEIGPFSGLIFTLQEKNIGNSFLIAAFPPGVSNFLREEVKARKLENKIEVIDSDPSLTGIDENTIDLAIFRGALFFPSLGQANFLEIHRVLKKGGIAFVGGGYGKYTPDTVIQEVGNRSRDLNLQLGKTQVSDEEISQSIQAIGIGGGAEIILEGGIWVLMKK